MALASILWKQMISSFLSFFKEKKTAWNPVSVSQSAVFFLCGGQRSAASPCRDHSRDQADWETARWPPQCSTNPTFPPPPFFWPKCCWLLVSHANPPEKQHCEKQHKPACVKAFLGGGILGRKVFFFLRKSHSTATDTAAAFLWPFFAK